MKRSRTVRLWFGVGFLLLLAVETLIALFVHDSFVRPYLGDVLVMAVLYCFLRLVLPVSVYERFRFRGVSGWILLLFLFALCVEILQGLHITQLLGLSGNAAARTIIGTSFDWADLLCYGVGCLLLWGCEWLAAWHRRRRISENEEKLP